MRALSWVEVAALVAVGGAALAAMVPAFLRNLEASRLAEPLDGLGTIAARASSLAAGQTPEEAYPKSVELTPAEVPRGEPQQDPPGAWQAPTWRRLDFGFSRPHSYAFSFQSDNAKDGASFVARAHGDLDGDGLLSTFELRGELTAGGEPRVLPVEIYREIE